MAIRNIVRFGDKILEKECRKVEVFDERLHQLLDDMQEACCARCASSTWATARWSW